LWDRQTIVKQPQKEGDLQPGNESEKGKKCFKSPAIMGPGSGRSGGDVGHKKEKTNRRFRRVLHKVNHQLVNKYKKGR